MARNDVRLRIELDGKSASRLNAALRVLGERDAPFLRDALEDVGQRFEREVAKRAPGGIAGRVDFIGVRGTFGGLAAKGRVAHPASRSMEFGRVWYWAGYTGRAVRATGRRVRRRGQGARPYMGIKNSDQAVGAIQPYARMRIQEAIRQEWERITEGRV